MELIEIVDENGNYTGQVMERKEAHEKNLLHNEIAVFFINDKKQVLLQKRSASKKSNPNKWGSCAGHVDAGESLEDAALREIKEEMGIEFYLSDLKILLEKEIKIRESNSHIVYWYYINCNLSESDFNIQEEELSEVKWFSIDEIINMIKQKDESLVFEEDRLYLFEKIKAL